MDENLTDGLDEIVRFVNSPGPKKAYSGRKYSKISTTGAVGIDEWTMKTNGPGFGYNMKTKFAGCFLILMTAIIVFMLALSFIPGIASAEAAPSGPQPPQPPPPPNGMPPPIPSELTSHPIEKPLIMGQYEENDDTIIQPQLSLTHSIQPIIGSIAIPNVLVILIGLAVVEKIKVRKKTTRLRVIVGG